MKLKFKIGVSIFVLVCLIFSGRYIYNAKSEPEIVTMHGKHESFESLSEMEAESEIIVIGKKLDIEKPVINKTPEDEVIDAHTLSEFKIEKIIKNETNIELEENHQITVLENGVFDSNFNGKKVYLNVDGYQLMKPNNKYVLFLRESLSHKGHYIPKGVVFGKVPLDSINTELLSIDDDNDLVNKVIKEAQEKYK